MPPQTQRKANKVHNSRRRVLVPVAKNGTEDVELTCITDVLSRFGAEVVTACVEDVGGRRGTATPTGDQGSRSSSLVCRTSRGLKIVADTTIQSASTQDWDLIALPGGIGGSRTLRSSPELMSLLSRHARSRIGGRQRPYGAIGASPSIVLASAPPTPSSASSSSKGLLLGPPGGRATCYPARVLRTALPNPCDDDVVVEGNVVTSQGPGTALKFALQLGEELYGKNMADKIGRQMLVDRYGRFDGSAGRTTAPKISLPRRLVTNSDSDSPDDGEGTSAPRRRKRSECDEPSDNEEEAESSKSNVKDIIDEAKIFREVLWPTLDRVGWTMENGPKKSDTFYCQPGVKRKNGIADESLRGITYFDSRGAALQCLMEEWSWNADVRRSLEIFAACLRRAADLVDMGTLSLPSPPGSSSVASLVAEVTNNMVIAELPLFEGIVLPQLTELGWTVEDGSRTRKKTYFPPSTKGPRFKEEGVDYFISPQQVLDCLRYNNVWASMDDVLRCLDVYQACISVGNELHREGRLKGNYSTEWLVQKTKERRPALSFVPHSEAKSPVNPQGEKGPSSLDGSTPDRVDASTKMHVQDSLSSSEVVKPPRKGVTEETAAQDPDADCNKSAGVSSIPRVKINATVLSTSSSKRKKTRDLRYDKAVATKLANPDMPELEALQLAGFIFKDTSKPDTQVLDSDGQTLRQRKNHLRSRLKNIPNKLRAEADAALPEQSDAKQRGELSRHEKNPSSSKESDDISSSEERISSDSAGLGQNPENTTTSLKRSVRQLGSVGPSAKKQKTVSPRSLRGSKAAQPPGKDNTTEIAGQDPGADCKNAKAVPNGPNQTGESSEYEKNPSSSKESGDISSSEERISSDRARLGQNPEEKMTPLKRSARQVPSAKKPGVKSPRTPRSSLRAMLFEAILWPQLERWGWTVEFGNRSTDTYYCQPGVKRGSKGSRCRVDYFDSLPQLLKCLESDERWSQREDVKILLEEYKTSLELSKLQKKHDDFSVHDFVEQKRMEVMERLLK